MTDLPLCFTLSLTAVSVSYFILLNLTYLSISASDEMLLESDEQGMSKLSVIVLLVGILLIHIFTLTDWVSRDSTLPSSAIIFINVQKSVLILGCFIDILVLYFFSLFSWFLLIHLWQHAAAVPADLSPDWLHHGLEDEGVWGGCQPSWGREEVWHHITQHCTKQTHPGKSNLYLGTGTVGTGRYTQYIVKW